MNSLQFSKPASRRSDAYRHPLPRGESLGQNSSCLAFDPGQAVVGTVRRMVKESQSRDSRRLADAYALLPGGMPVSSMAGEFIVGIHAVVDQEIGAVSQGLRC